MIKIERNFNNREEKNSNNSSDNKKKFSGQKQEKPVADSLNPDLFISRNESTVVPYETSETKSFSFSDLKDNIKLFLINLINRLWWGPSYIKMKSLRGKESGKITPKPQISQNTPKNPLVLNLSKR